MSSILYYITGHGFDHAVRALAAIRPGLRIQVRTTAPEAPYRNSTTPIYYSHQGIATGIVQTDSLHMELAETLAACRAIYGNTQKLIETALHS